MSTALVIVKYVVLITAVTQPTRWVVKKAGGSENLASAIAMGLGNYVGRSYLDKHRKGGRA